MLLEFVRRAEQIRMPLDEREPLILEQRFGTWLHVQLIQLRLVVEQIMLRRRAGHVQVDNTLRLRRKHRRLRRQGILLTSLKRKRGFRPSVALQQRPERDRAQAGVAVLEELTASLSAS